MPNPDKKIVRVGDDELQLRLDTADRSMPDSRAKRRAQKLLEELRDKQVRALKKIVRQVVDKELTPDGAARAARSVIVPILFKAGTVGFDIVGLRDWEMTDDQLDELIRLAEAETEFFKNFMDAVASEALDRDVRTELYGGSVGDAFWRAWTMGLPSVANIWWKLSVAEHCEDCLALAAGSPYSKPGTGSNPLPTVPRAGDTRCLARCKCFVESEGIFESGLLNRVGVEVTSLGAIAIDPMSEGGLAAAAFYQELADRYAYHSRMAILEPGAGHRELARGIRREMEQLATRLGHGLRFTQTPAEMAGQVRLAKALGYKFIAPSELSDDLLLAIATVVALNSSFRGKITSVKTDPPTVVLDDTDEFRLDAVGRNILFLVEP